MQNNKLYGIFRECFPTLSIPENVFYDLTDIESCEIICLDGGFALMQKNALRLLCVESSHRNMGVGASLLKICEEKAAPYKKLILGGYDSQLFIGAPCGIDFFRKHGFEFTGHCYEMELDLKNFSPALPIPDGVEFSIYHGDTDTLLSAVAKVDPDWVQYFQQGDHVFAAAKKGVLSGFCLIEDNAECILSSDDLNIGIVGCVGVIPEMRSCGIGLSIVEHASEYLKNLGCDKIFIHFTHLHNWYSKIGCRTFLEFTFGYKNI